MDNEMVFNDLDQQGELRFRQFADCLPQIIWICTVDGLCDYLSHRWEDYTGNAAAEQLGAHWLQQIHPDDREQLLQDWMVAINAGEVIKKVFRIRRHDGIFHWFEIHGLPVRNASGQIIRWLGSCTDIQEQIEMREAAHASEQRLRDQQVLLERMSSLAKVGGWGFDVASMQGTWTDEVARIHDLEPTDAVSAHDGLSYFQGESRQKIEVAVQAAIQHAQPYDLELQMRTAANASKWIRTQSVPIVENGRVVRLEGAIQDITARKQAELALQALNERLEHQVVERTADADHARLDLQATLDAIPAVVVYLDHELRARYANLAADRFLGRSIDEVRGKTFAEIAGAAQYARRKPYFDAALQGIPQTFEAELPRTATAELAPRFAQIHFIPAIRQERVQGLYVMFFDITNLKNAQSGLRAANQELEAFSYAVAHDLRAPLRAMNGFSCALLEDCAESLDDFAKEYAREIITASNRMSELLDGLLRLSRSTQGEMQRDMVDLTLLAKKIRDELQKAEPQRTVQWQITEGLRAFGDAHMLELLLQNLLGNAWKYSNRNLQPLIIFDLEHQDGNAWFRVADNGAGFDMAHANRLFKPFQRLHRQDEFVGIGVGLATVQRIVHRHGGQIRADAVPGKGARFYFTLGINPVYAGVA